MMKIVLFQPQIPQNTGNIVRTCSVTNTGLILVRPLGFVISDKTLKRAGLDYWNEVDIEYIDDLESYLENTKAPFYFLSSKAKKRYTDIQFQGDELLIFGSETSGLPKKFFEKWTEKFCTVPMAPKARCLNLSNTAAIVVYEGLRQLDFNSFSNP
jgi:tRNA (cytidine/uridine-2'-O-)-methyltransferase